MSLGLSAPLPLACNLAALDAAERKQHGLVTEQLFATLVEVRELADGYAFGCRQDDTLWMKAAQFVDRERRCCSFFTFGLELDNQTEVVWLRLSGPDGVKDFIQQEFIGNLPAPVTVKSLL
jgi:hypothetical protein